MTCPLRERWPKFGKHVATELHDVSPAYAMQSISHDDPFHGDAVCSSIVHVGDAARLRFGCNCDRACGADTMARFPIVTTNPELVGTCRISPTFRI